MHDLPAHFVTPMLFLGPLYGRYLARDLPFMKPQASNISNKKSFNWIAFRNYVVVRSSLFDSYESLMAPGSMQGPISEEVVWRSCIVCAYSIAGASSTSIVFFTPISFGSGMSCSVHGGDTIFKSIPAHLHHVWETYNMYGRTRQALRRALFLAREESFTR